MVSAPKRPWRPGDVALVLALGWAGGAGPAAATTPELPPERRAIVCRLGGYWTHSWPFHWEQQRLGWPRRIPSPAAPGDLATAEAPLAAALAFGGTELASSAALALGRLPGAPSPAAANALAAAASDGRPDVRRAALVALGLRAGAEALALLSAELDRGPDRAGAALALGLAGARGETRALLDRAESTADDDLAACAIRALGLLRPLDLDVVQRLAAIVRDGTRTDVVRAQVAPVLARSGAPLGESVIRELLYRCGDRMLPTLTRGSAILAAGASPLSTDPCAVEYLESLARGPSFVLFLANRALAVHALGAATATAGARACLLAQVRPNPSRYFQVHAALALERSAREAPPTPEGAAWRQQAMGALLVEFERSGDPYNKGALALALAHAGALDARDALLSAGSEARDPFLLRCTGLALGILGDARALPLLRSRAIGHEDPAVRRDAALSLGWLGDGAALPLLAAALTAASDPDERANAARALGDLGDAGALSQLLGIAGDAQEPESVRAAAAAAIGDLLDPRPRSWLAPLFVDHNPRARTPSLDWLAARAGLAPLPPVPTRPAPTREEQPR